jgi:hypothetical protein
MITCYPCSKARHYVFWQALRSAGLPIVHPCWIDAEFNATGEEPSHDEWAAHWYQCCNLAATCEVTLFLALPGEQHAGALAEIGACLGAGRQLFAVSAVDFSFLRHPRSRVFPSLEAAVSALMAMQMGEKARQAA